MIYLWEFIHLFESRSNHSGLIVSDMFPVMLDISVSPVHCAHSHGSNIVRVGETFSDSSSDTVIIVRGPSPLGKLHTGGFFHEGWGEGVSHSHSLLFPIFAGGCLVPVPREEIVVDFVAQINSSDHHDPHTEWTVTVDSVLLEISVHFVSVWIFTYLL